ncbi:MAG: hypothetical protein WBW33_15775 [Bryobacteraceae bacterium]
MAKIYYKFHPYVGKDVRILRRFRALRGNDVEIQLADGTHQGIPGWMLDEQACLDTDEQDSPRIAVLALNHLQRMLSAQPLLQRARGSILPGQEAHAENQTTTTASVSAGGDSSKPIAGTEGAHHRAAEPDAARDSTKGTINKQGGN